MSKLTREEKIEIYKKRKRGVTITSLSKEYKINRENIKYLIKLIDYNGIDILRNGKNRYYSLELKEEIINRVLIDKKSLRQTAIEYGLLNKGILYNWIKKYKEMGYNIVEKPKGRPTMKTNKQIKVINPNNKEDLLKQKEKEILYLKAENEYLKKLHAVIQAKEKQQQKKK